MNTALVKLKQLLSSQFGKELEFRRLIDLSKMRVDSEPVVHGSDLYIPIIVQEQFLGAAIIHQGWELSSEMKQSAVQLVRKTLEPELYIEYLSRRRTNLHSLIESESHETSLTLVGEENLITSLLHLQGHDNSLIKKVALQIHDFSARWAFVSFEDICEEISTEMDICNLGGMTIFFENIENLSPKHQELLAEYLKSPRSLSEPLILTSSTLSMEGLSERLVNTELSKDIQASHLEVQRAPLNSQMLRDLLDLFFHKDEFQDLH